MTITAREPDVLLSGEPIPTPLPDIPRPAGVVQDRLPAVLRDRSVWPHTTGERQGVAGDVPYQVRSMDPARQRHAVRRIEMKKPPPVDYG